MDRDLAQARSDLQRLVARAADGELGQPPEVHRVDARARAEYRPAAVLLLFTPTLVRPGLFPALDLFLVQRSPLLRHHPGQIALPGGRADPGDAGPAGTALREAHEEIGLPPERVEVIGTLPEVAVPISRFLVTPVVGWAADPGDLARVEVGEVLHTLRLPVSELLDPSGRSTVTIHGHGSAGFAVTGGWVWGFTGNLLDGVFDELGWTRPWDRGREYAMSMAEARGDTLPPPTPEG
ncbi:CoA pyrophosphatase [Georgenia phoenicis]|uniref:NUDIX hydrolase n=1 Tax=unclassified Georgenia TaxID=2626815 RepID=UPI0039AEFFFD